jgi:hypothetical protein
VTLVGGRTSGCCAMICTTRRLTGCGAIGRPGIECGCTRRRQCCGVSLLCCISRTASRTRKTGAGRPLRASRTSARQSSQGHSAATPPPPAGRIEEAAAAAAAAPSGHARCSTSGTSSRVVSTVGALCTTNTDAACACLAAGASACASLRSRHCWPLAATRAHVSCTPPSGQPLERPECTRGDRSSW